MSTTLHLHRVPVTTTYADVKVGDRLRAGAVGLATVKATHDHNGRRMVVIGKPGWRAGRMLVGPPETAITVLRADTYIRFTTDEGVQVLDLTHPDTEFTPEGDHGEYKYATVCTEHSSICTHTSIADAKRHATDPAGWCEVHEGRDDA